MASRIWIVACAGWLGACASKGDDTAGGAEGDADTDADTDSDTDADADTDVGWHGDTLAVDLWFGWDASTSQVATASVNGEALPNAATVTIFNLADVGSKAPTQFCVLRYALDGVQATDARFATYWMGFDLTYATPEVGVATDDGPGDCAGLGSFIDVTRGIGQPVEQFVSGLGFGAGIGALGTLEFETEEEWESYWSADGWDVKYGDWTVLERYFAVAGFTSAVGTLEADTAPSPFGITYAYGVDEKWNVTVEGKQAVALDLSKSKDAPTAYYETMSLYVYGTGF